MFQRRPEGRLGPLGEQQKTGLQTAADGHGRQKHPVLREGQTLSSTWISQKWFLMWLEVKLCICHFRGRASYYILMQE